MVPTPPRSPRGSTVVAWAVGALAVAVAVTAAWLDLTGDAGGAQGPAKPLLLTAVWVVPGVLITTARPRLVLGWLALGEALLFAAVALGDAWIRAGAEGAALAWSAWVTDRFSAFLAVGVWVVLVLLPDGHVPSRAWRPWVGAVVVVQSLALAAFCLVRGPAASPDSSLPARAQDVANPVGVLPETVDAWLAGMDTLLLQVPLLLCLAAYVVRLRRAGPDERVRVVGVLLAASTFVLLVVLGHAWWPDAADALDVVAGALLSAQLTATVLGRRPRAVAVAVRQTFVYTVLTAAVGGFAVAGVALLEARGHDLPGFGIAVIAAGTALAVHPLRLRLARIVDRLLYGDLHDPYRALQRLADRTHRAPSVDAVLEGLAATVAASLRVPWTSARAGTHAGAWGERPPGAEEEAADLVSGMTRLGTLIVTPGRDRRLRPDEVRLLADLGRHGGVAVQAALLSEELQAGRQRLVVTREEERRRLRRDLHDEVGPTLAGLTMQLAVTRELVHSDPEAAADRLGRLQEAAREALDTVRRVSHGLRPPALDELGLDGALRQLAESLGLEARFPDAEPAQLPAAVEVAGYLIAAEALHNVARHAGTGEVEVSVRRDDGAVVVSVRDGGVGVDALAPAGVGLLAMRERAEELGGTLTLDSVPGGGTTVTARLPAPDAQARVG